MRLDLDFASILEKIDKRLYKVEMITTSPGVMGGGGAGQTNEFDSIVVGGVEFDSVPPGKPLNLSATTQVFYNEVSADLSWDAPENGKAVTYLIELSRRTSTDPENWYFEQHELALGTDWRLDGLLPNSTYRFRVQGRNRFGIVGEWSDYSEPFATGMDTEPPPQVGPPLLTRGATALIVDFQGLTESEAADVAWGRGLYEVHIASNAAFTQNVQEFVGSATIVSFANLTFQTTWYARVRAIDSSGNPGQWSETASLLAGQIISGDIAEGAIKTINIDNQAVNEAKIATDAITEVKIAPNAITPVKIAENAITEIKIAPAAITAGKIKDGSIGSGKISDGAITETKILDDAITTGKIAANAITADEIAAEAITADEIAANAIVAGKIAANAVTANKIRAGAIEADKIAANAVTATKIDAGAVTANKISAGAVEAEKVAANAITAGKIAATAIQAGHIAAGQIQTGHLVANAITAEKIAANQITANKIASNQIVTDHIAAGQITSDMIHSVGLSAVHIKFGAMNGDRITANTLDVNTLKTSTLSSGNIRLNGGSIRVGASPTINGLIINSQGIRAYNGGSETVVIDGTGSATFRGTIDGSWINSSFFVFGGGSLTESHGLAFQVGQVGFVTNRSISWRDTNQVTSTVRWRFYAANQSELWLQRVNQTSGHYSRFSIDSNRVNFSSVNGISIGYFYYNGISNHGLDVSTLYATSKYFIIDHPEDPDDKLLVHACVEGPEHGVYYRGNGTVGEDGEVVITLPSYFEALTSKDGRSVQVTPVGKPSLLSATLPESGEFSVHGEPAQEFSWHVYAERKDIDPLEIELSKSELRDADKLAQVGFFEDVGTTEEVHDDESAGISGRSGNPFGGSYRLASPTDR